MTLDEITIGIDVDVWHYPQIDAVVATAKPGGRTDPIVLSKGVHE